MSPGAQLPSVIARRDTMEDKYKYRYECRYCGAKPEIAGPHHANTCERFQSALDLAEAEKSECRFCDVRPFTAGVHHKEGCVRHVSINWYGMSPGMSSIDLAKLKEKGERFSQAWWTDQMISKIKRGW